MIDPLRLLTLPWRAVNRVRRALYRRGLLRPSRLPRPVISIGSLGAGGAGKTPAVIAVCRALAGQEIRVAVLTRGYGRGGDATGLVTSLDAVKFGDEPVLIKRSISGDVIVGAKRFDNAIEYLRDNDCDVFVLDDGFQHLQLHRDLDIVIDAPARVEREGRPALRDAHIVVPRRLRTLVPAAARERGVFAFSGLADNAQFFAALRDAGVDLVGARGFADHHRYTPGDLAALKEEAGGAPLITTEKDAVKIGDPSLLIAGAEMEIEPAVIERIVATAKARPSGGGKKKRRKGVVQQRAEYAAFRAVSRAVSWMSEESAHRWGARLGALARRVLRSRDRLAMRNLRYVFPDRDEGELRRILDDCWRHFGREGLLYLRLQSLTLSEVAEHCPMVHVELLEESIARGKGTILMSAHWGGWEVGGLAIMSVVDDIRTVARPLDNDLLERDLQRFRASTGAEVVDRRRAARVLMRGLSENAVLVLLPDQAVQQREGILVPFLGRPAWTTPAPARLALRAGATIVISFCVPEGLRHRLEFVESIRTDLLPEDERNPEALMRRINDVLSKRIRQQPELWLWMHDRWKGTAERGAHAV